MCVLSKFPGSMYRSPVHIHSYRIQWSLDGTFTSGVSTETCVEGMSDPYTRTAAGDVCNFWETSASIPRIGVLDHTKRYWIRVAAVTAAGLGVYTAPILAPYATSYPSAPRNLAVTRNYPIAGSVIPLKHVWFWFTWDAPENRGGGGTMQMTRYSIQMAIDGVFSQPTEYLKHVWFAPEKPRVHQINLRDFAMGRTYHVRVTVDNHVSYRSSGNAVDLSNPLRSWSETIIFTACTGYVTGRNSTAMCSECVDGRGFAQKGDGSDVRGECACLDASSLADGSAGFLCCSAGFYMDHTTNCTACPSGTTSLPQSEKLTDCVCMAHHTAASAGVECNPCGEGLYKPSVGVGECRLTPEHVLQQEQATDVCDCTWASLIPRIPSHVA